MLRLLYPHLQISSDKKYRKLTYFRFHAWQVPQSYDITDAISDTNCQRIYPNVTSKATIPKGHIHKKILTQSIMGCVKYVSCLIMYKGQTCFTFLETHQCIFISNLMCN